ncbi:hypothetical protein B0T17DRAFT_586442 [Bombardia bombarda]|uniref:Histone deacetylase n=1 Tax=Bombardia bombarda TaxID=252184 RepID=A0AA39XK05_9PEZI|nr:hypothetical protein B0T17DRAFT_586442 [Bombardia bombarda]
MTSSWTGSTFIRQRRTDEDLADDDDAVISGGLFPTSLRRRGILPTGCCSDPRMKLHANADFGPNPHHPEDPARIEYIMRTLKANGLVFKGSDADLLKILKKEPAKYMYRIPAREATREEICTVHHPQHFSWVEGLSKKPTDELRLLSSKLDQGRDSLYVGSMTFEASLISAGGAIETCKHVVNGTVKNAIAVIRPPGHHAEFNQAMGFCLFNNVPIAAKICQTEYPEKCRKVLILDWDVHHGNGIQNMFYDDANILYISIHVYMNGAFYPGKPDNPMTPDGGIEMCGAGPGLGKNINIGWHEQGMGDAEYMHAFQKIVMPIAYEFDPDLVIISAGFDAADGDELGGCFVTPECYAHMTHMLMSLANGKVAVCLEGGYNLEAISKSALAVAQTLMGEPPPRLEPNKKLNKDAARLIAKVQAIQAPYWECMRPGIVDVQDLKDQGSMRLHDVIRKAQRQGLQEKHNMIPMYIHRDILFRSFENQVLVTPGLFSARKLLIIVHDPPELHAQPDPLTNRLDAHNTYMVDGVTEYINWAIANNFGVIDINVPHYITHPQDNDAFTPRPNEKALQAQIQDLITYIWDNHLQIHDADNIFLMGVGNAYLGIKVLLINRDVKSRISGVVNFVNGNLRPVKSDVDQDLSGWYKENSRVYVANDHACWADADYTRKVHKRRFGTVIRSDVNGLTRMMREHFGDVQQWVMGRLSSEEDEEEGHGDTTEEEKFA